MKWPGSARPAAQPESPDARGELSPVDGGPRHVAIIMDGNGRWAKARRLPRVAGHRAGVDAVRRIVRAAPRLGIETLTLYAFSSENWSRPADEVSDLMSLLRHHLLAELEELHANGARLGLIGDWRSLKGDVVERLENALAATSGNSRFRLVVALNYGGQDELARAMRSWISMTSSSKVSENSWRSSQAVSIQSPSATSVRARVRRARSPAPCLRA